MDFTGRDAELATLQAWRDRDDVRLAARWLFAPGGQGKTRLSLELASQSNGWKVINAIHGTGAEPSGQHDLRSDGHRGVLVLLDYADPWPLSHLQWLLSNTLFHQQVPTRVLFVARNADAWPSVRAVLTSMSADTSEQLLAPLSDQSRRKGSAEHEDRVRMFQAARDSFGRKYELTNSHDISPPFPLDEPGFGLTLSIHMAALVLQSWFHGESWSALDE